MTRPSKSFRTRLNTNAFLFGILLKVLICSYMLALGRDFVGSWVQIGMPAKQKTLSLMEDRPFHEQCSFCEQVISTLAAMSSVTALIVTTSMLSDS